MEKVKIENLTIGENKKQIYSPAKFFSHAFEKADA
ncbi:hypothetical protein BCD96_003121 [Clostridium beijerinckii]|nr:hypothetical protein [Clostridium beijerinckii]NRU38493.1 hypothetical protein [Clostridium beijerinckii]NSA98228.1 hypothetical protein [Clostridium beijerinckii]OOM61735.1 hypothetical protein CLOBI_25410 [Clostridium beijerinckii]OOM68133.1 hypothetical protein CLBEIC_36020 [Clostridium beijerinckii]